MLLSRSRIAWLAALALVGAGRPALADETTDPLRLVPVQADVVVKIENPRQLAEAVYELDALKELQKFDAVKEFYNSTNVKRFNQLVDFYEKKLGAKKYDLLEKLAGGGMAAGLKIEQKPGAVLVIQGKDEKTVQEFFKTSIELVQQELARQEKKEKIVKKDYQGIETVGIGPEFCAAAFGSTMILASKPDALKASLDLHLNKGGQSVLTNKSLTKARKMLQEKMLAWAWLNLQSVRKIPDTKEFFETSEKVSQLNFTFFGAFVDVAKRSDFVCAGLYQKDKQFTLTVQFPAGLKGMSDKVAGLFPEKTGSTLPLLEPKNVLSSTSYNLDLALAWKNRAKVLLPQELKNTEDLDVQSGKFLAGVKMSELLLMSGAHQRVVVTLPTTSVYKKKPKLPIQSFAVVHEMGDPQLANKLDRIIRIGALALTTQFNLDLHEEKYKGVNIVSYRFVEDKPFKGDDQDIRFNFSPSYAWVGALMPVSNTSVLGDSSLKGGGSAWMGRRSAVRTGPRPSIGSPSKLKTRPSVSLPTGTCTGAPVSVTFMPRTSPSVEPRATARTRLPPRCCCTSPVRRMLTSL